MDHSDIRLLVVSPLADRLNVSWLGVRWEEVATASTPEAVRAVVQRERPRFDVVMVDLMWNSFAEEWSFDGLDAIAQLVDSKRNEPVLLACQGHGFERDYLEEGREVPIVRGMFLKSQSSAILDAAVAVANGRKFLNQTLEQELRPRNETLAYWFDREPALARIAGVIAAGHGPDYRSIATVMNLSTSSVEKMLDLFRCILMARGEVGPDGHLEKAAVFRWCGEHAHYILSWCRRNRARQTLLKDLAPGVFTKRLTMDN